MATKTIPQLTANTTPATTALMEVSDAAVSGKTTIAQVLTAALATKTANTVLAGPTTGAAAAPAFRALVAADIPTGSGLLSVNDAVSAAGTVQGDGTLIAAQANTVTTCATGAGIRLPVAASAAIGSLVFLKNTTANTCKVWPDSGAAIDALATNASYALEPNIPTTFIRMGALQWRGF